MKRSIIAILGVVLLATAPLAIVYGSVPKKRSESVVFVNGARYIVRTVVAGDTLYSISKEYGVSAADIIRVNPAVAGGLQVNAVLKIPYEMDDTKEVSVRKLSKMFDIHTVGRGETIYAISRRYQIAVSQILEDNPNLDPARLSIGDRINIRKDEQGQTSEAETKAELDNYRQQINSVLDSGLAYHLVDRDDTLESLMAEFDMREGEIEDLNGLAEGQNPTVGTLILVNDMSDVESDVVLDLPSIDFKTLADDDTLEVALLLPLSIRGYAMKPFVEFYQGFLMGVEDLKRGGRNVVVNLFNTERDEMAIGRILADEAFKRSNLIVGPVYENLLPKVLEYAEGRDIPVVSPLVTLSNQDSRVLFQMAPLPAQRYDKLDSFIVPQDSVALEVQLYETLDRRDSIMMHIRPEFMMAQRDSLIREQQQLQYQQQLLEREETMDETRRAKMLDSLRAKRESVIIYSDEDLMIINRDTVALRERLDSLMNQKNPITLIYGETNDSLYDVEVRNVLAKYGKTLNRYDYLYEHPSVIAEREKLAEERIKEAQALADSLFYFLDDEALDSLQCEPSKSDLTPLICNESESNIFFVMSDNEIEVDRILSALASAYTAQVAQNRGTGRNMSKILNFCVVANPAWRDYSTLDKTLFFRNRLVNFPSYIAGRDSQKVRAFDGRYSEEFSDFPSLYAYRGYDVAKIFGEGMYRDIRYGMEGKLYSPLQSEYYFERGEDHVRWVNTNWMKVKYNLNFTLTIE